MAAATDLQSPWTSPDPWTPPPPPAATNADGWPTDATMGLPTTPATGGAASTAGGGGTDSFLKDTGGTAPAPGSGVPASSVTAVTDYQSHLDAINRAPDPQTSAVAKDTLARQLQSDLTADGHDVAWKGDTMLIDGRPYEVAGAPGTVGVATVGRTDREAPVPPTTPTPAPTPAPAPPPTPPGGNVATNPDGSPQTPPGPNPAPSLQNKVANFITQFAKAHPNVNPSVLGDTAYWTKQISSWFPDGNIDWGYVEGRMMQPEGPPEGPKPPGDTISEQDALDYTTRYARIVWGREPTAADLAKLKTDLGYTPGTALPRSILTQLETWVQNNKPKAGPTPPPDPGPGLPPGFADWTPGAPYYLPTFEQQTNDIPDFQTAYDKLSAGQPGDKETETLVQKILQHPESLTDQEVETLKAKNAEETALGAQAQDEELQHFGYQSGLENSPWLASRRAGAAWDRRAATIAGNRSIDLTSAQTRQADREKAAQLGSAYTSYRATRQQTAVNMAVESAVARATESRNRSAFNESLKQAATSLGMSRDQLTLSYMNMNLDYLTKNKAIDTNFQLTMKQLNQQSDQFKQTLLQRIAELKQQDDQFRANYGLDLQRVELLKNNDAWERAKTLYGL